MSALELWLLGWLIFAVGYRWGRIQPLKLVRDAVWSWFMYGDWKWETQRYLLAAALVVFFPIRMAKSYTKSQRLARQSSPVAACPSPAPTSTQDRP